MEGTIVEKKETTEVIGLDGKTQQVNGTPLADLFDKIEQGKQEGKSATQVVKEVTPEKPQDKERNERGQFVKEEKKPEPQQEKSELEKKLDAKQEEKKEPVKEEKQDEDLRTSLRKASEATEKKEEKVETKPEEEIPDEELQVLTSDKPKTAKRIQALLKRVDAATKSEATTKKELEAKAKRLQELENQLSSTKTIDPETQKKIDAQQNELAMYRRRYELDTDPEVKSKFEGRVEGAEKAIVDTLKKNGAGDGLIKLIADEGGWGAFASSRRIVPIPDGEGGTKNITAAELAEAVLGQIPFGERKAVEAAMLEQAQTKREKERFFKEEQAKANDYFKQRDEESKKLTAAQQQQIEEAKKTIDNYQKAVLESEWLKDKEIPANATPAQKAEAEQHNKYNSQLRTLLQSALSVKDLNGMLELVKDSVLYYNERRTTQALRKEVEQLRNELATKTEEMTKFRKASGTVTKSGSIAVAPTTDDRQAKKPRSLEDAFDALERGENIKDQD